MKQNQTFFHGTYSNLPSYFFIKKQCFIDFQNQTFSVLWLKWTQTMELKQNQTFFHWAYLNLMSFFYQKISVFQSLSKPNFLSFIAKVNPSNENETKSDIFHGTYSNLKYFFIGCKILKYLNDFFYWHLSISLQNWAQKK